MALRNKRGPKPALKFTAKLGAQVRDNKKGGFDWIRYREEVLKPLYIPFIKHLQSTFGSSIKFLAQEHNAAPHASRWCKELWAKHGIETLYWPSNSPDPSAAEGPWFPMKCATEELNKHGGKAAMKKAWEDQWDSFPLSELQRYIEQTRCNVAWVVYLK